MKKAILLYSLLLFIPTVCFSQVVRQGEKFTEVPVVNGKILFLKEIPAKKDVSMSANYKTLKSWAVDRYGKDPFNSSIRYEGKNSEFIAKSRIELLLPHNEKGIREKMTMRYRINGFIFYDKCVFEVTDISYMYENSSKDKSLPKIIKGEDFITDEAINMNSEHTEIKTNTRKSTLFFLDELSKSFEEKFGY
ncbi:hypothetical protein [Dysgonomonas sp. 511]|uniref:hypothetical protein n=1 Tax=Dysgonomonas sp. 511 TaxID=2302930 RepID=UPI0013CF7F42|nr:hypothetical protein [Dysgonomonas sp. 511]NDV77646.1 hypothetical protein [Dysgonomonas sp. 511]